MWCSFRFDIPSSGDHEVSLRPGPRLRLWPGLRETPSSPLEVIPKINSHHSWVYANNLSLNLEKMELLQNLICQTCYEINLVLDFYIGGLAYLLFRETCRENPYIVVLIEIHLCLTLQIIMALLGPWWINRAVKTMQDSGKHINFAVPKLVHIPWFTSRKASTSLLTTLSKYEKYWKIKSRNKDENRNHKNIYWSSTSKKIEYWKNWEILDQREILCRENIAWWNLILLIDRKIQLV